MASKLGLYNSALRLLGSQRITALTDAAEGRYYLDDCYDEVLAECLESGQWNFATKTLEIESSTSIDPTFGYEYAFQKPTDLARLCAISSSDQLWPPLDRYADEVGYWWADVDPLYVSFVSNAIDYGNDLALWPATYSKYVYTTLAERICMSVTQSDNKLSEIIGRVKQAKIEARSNDAMGQPAPVVSTGSWVDARQGGGRYSGQRYRRA
jgi:hypothetical protein